MYIWPTYLCKICGFMLRSGMKQLTVLVFLLLGAVCANAQNDPSELRKAIAYYQQLKFDEALSLFDQLVADDETDMFLVGRRGFVCCQYIKAMEENLVARVSDERYNEIIAMGITDLQKSAENGDENPDNKVCLQYLKKMR